MADNSGSDTESNNSYSTDEVFNDKVEKTEKDFLAVAPIIRRHGFYWCPLCPGKKPQPWCLRELLAHATMLGRSRTGAEGPKHKALANHILNNPDLAHAREEGRVGDCGGNEAVAAARDRAHSAHRAVNERRKKKRLDRMEATRPYYKPDNSNGDGSTSSN